MGVSVKPLPIESPKVRTSAISYEHLAKEALQALGHSTAATFAGPDRSAGGR